MGDETTNDEPTNDDGPPKFRLTERDEEILEHLRRYRISTKEVLHGLFFEDSEPAAVLKVMRRLTQVGLASTHNPDGLPQYFRVGPEYIRLRGLSRKSCYPHGVQALPIHLGILLLCCTGDRRPERLTNSEIARNNPEILLGKKSRVNYLRYLNPATEKNELCIGRVDLGGPPHHVARQCERDIERLSKNEAILALMLKGQFAMEVVTVSREKAEQIAESIRGRKFVVPFRLSVEPSLAPYIVRLPTSRFPS